MQTRFILGLAGAAVVLAGAIWVVPLGPKTWTPEEVERIRSLALTSLPPLPPDPSNRVADDPDAAALGEKLFFDTRFSSNGKVACATCHQPDRQFQDDLPLARGVGTTGRRTMPIAGMAYAPFLFWDGRKDSLWAQALGPLESAVEHGGDRTQYARLVSENYAAEYEQIFGPLPDLSRLPDHAGPVADSAAAAAWNGMTESEREAVSGVFANIGKAIAAYERTILPQTTRFDLYAAAVGAGDAAGILTDEERAGLAIFVGKGECTNCHNGALLTDNHFHNTGVPLPPGQPEDRGRALGALSVRQDPFNCLGPYSDAKPEDCVELRFMVDSSHELEAAFKTPSLRGVASRAPYMEAGQIASLAEVIDHYAAAPHAAHGHSELRPVALSPDERAALVAFLGSLDAE
jgi:cytochrome c peroxidase